MGPSAIVLNVVCHWYITAIALDNFMKAFGIILIYVLLSCNTTKSSNSVENSFLSGSYDSNVIRNLDKYKLLRDLLVSNIDTIIKFRNVQAHNEFHNHSADIDKLVGNETTYNFSVPFGKGQSADEISLKTLPSFIFPKVDSICKALGYSLIYGFRLERLDSSVTISIKTTYDEQSKATAYHQIQTDPILSENNSLDYFVKDTMLAPRLHYHLTVGHDPGR
ncbi:MAG: hypothetical protein WKF91_09425 [Segetibacter sp.]